MWTGKVIDLNDWSEFSTRLNRELNTIGCKDLLLIRNFALFTCEVDDDGQPIGDTDRLDLVYRTGTDRDVTSTMWNEPDHDHDHDCDPKGKSPEDIIYAYVAELTEDGYRVHYLPQGEPEHWDLTEGLSEIDGILVYNASKLNRASKNEHWFIGDPCDVLMLVFKLRDE